MPESHGRLTFVSLAATDISTYTDTTTFNQGADEHDSTAYGAVGHEFAGGLKTGSITIGGKYVTGATGPRAVIAPLLGTVVSFIYRPEGTGVGKPQDTANVLVKAYNQSSPVADIVRWTAELTVSGVVTPTTQA